MPKRETVEQKGWRLFISGAVWRGLEYWWVRGDHEKYRVESGRCNCPSYSRCSHEVAVEYARGIAPAPRRTVEVDAERLAALIRVAMATEKASSLLGAISGCPEAAPEMMDNFGELLGRALDDLRVAGEGAPGVAA